MLRCFICPAIAQVPSSFMSFFCRSVAHVSFLFSHRPCPSSVDPSPTFFGLSIADAPFFCPSVAHILDPSINGQPRSSFVPPIVISRPSVHPLPIQVLLLSIDGQRRSLFSIHGQYRSFFCPLMVGRGPSSVHLLSVQVLRLSISRQYKYVCPSLFFFYLSSV